MPEPTRYGLDNPHPLSQMKTELIWAGKYDATGRKVAPVRVKLPFQTVETVNESSQQRQFALDLFSTGREAEWRNRLIWGDKKYVLPALLEEFAGQVDLIYIDPPFNVGADFSFQVEDRGSADSPKNQVSLSRRPIVIPGAWAWIRTCNGSSETAVLLREFFTERGSHLCASGLACRALCKSGS